MAAAVQWPVELSEKSKLNLLHNLPPHTVLAHAIPGVLSEARYSDAEMQSVVAAAAAVAVAAVAAFLPLLLPRQGTARPPGPTVARCPAGRDSSLPRPCPASRAAPKLPWWPSTGELCMKEPAWSLSITGQVSGQSRTFVEMTL